MAVCRTDGTEVAESRSGRLVHVAGLPDGVDPDHEIVAIEEADYRAARQERSNLRLAAEELLVHHATIHPLADCEWASRLRTALRTA